MKRGRFSEFCRGNIDRVAKARVSRGYEHDANCITYCFWKDRHGRPIKEIAEELNRSYTSINNARKRYWKSRSSKTFYTEDEEALIKEYYGQGKSEKEIAAMLGRTGNAINSYRFKRRLVNSDLKWTYEEQETLLMYVILDHTGVA